MRPTDSIMQDCAEKRERYEVRERKMDTKKDIKSLKLEELKTELESMGEKAFRAKQMYEWMHVKLVRSFFEMTNLSAKFRKQKKEK